MHGNDNKQPGTAWIDIDPDLTLPVAPAASRATTELVGLAQLQEAASGGFQHLDEQPTLQIEEDAAWRLHGRRKGVDKPPMAHIETYGCQMNAHDSEIMYGILGQMGYAMAPDVSQADLLLFNTCAVRESAVEHAFGRIGQLKPLKYTNPDMVIGVSGCVPQVDGQIDRMLHTFPHLDLIFGTHNIHQLPKLIEQARDSRETVVDVWDSMSDEIIEHLPTRREGNLKAYVTIAYGCDKKCTYCIVPTTRGPERSRDPYAILAEVQELGRQGFKEVTLLGQNVNSYGKDLGTTDFGQLLTLLDDNTPGIERIRYTTSHPKDFKRHMVEAIANSKKVTEWYHLPVQSGSDSVLRRMKRSYNIKQYMQLVEWVRELDPEAGITTDIIVGFPGETEEEFAATLQLVEQVGYDAAFMFMYSERAGTEAAQMADRLSVEEKKERLQRLIDVQNRTSKRINDALVGRVEEILVEGLDKDKTDVVFGRTRSNKLVTFPGTSELVGKLVPVRITASKTFSLVGEVAGPAYEHTDAGALTAR